MIEGLTRNQYVNLDAFHVIPSQSRKAANPSLPQNLLASSLSDKLDDQCRLLLLTLCIVEKQRPASSRSTASSQAPA